MTILSAHPIAPAVRQRIEAELRLIEEQHHVRVLFACESGSRGWGFASPDSDYDVRFVYVHQLDWYLQVEPQRDVIELPINDELDISGWELRKALQLLHRSNPTLLEWLCSPVIYREEIETTARLRELADQFYFPLRVRHHYQAMAIKNNREHLTGDLVKLKKYLYVLRPILAMNWIDAGLGKPPMRFAELVEGTITESALLDEINALLKVKMQAGEAASGPRWPLIHAFIDKHLQGAERDLAYRKPAGDSQALDRLLQDAILVGRR
ncbi:hypothetical protein HNQ59_000436 [Chitinivorax tropicus]|uniref:Nucleotidyltransferase domain-containing protein n=1 Tax=Chitinivorax tropicus TaxID=714531 RepID=A0A840MCZ1_9PROT|nr:nucleotidyltransferase domain-containing protein [Chitinivorax tropicus]MBB5017174.1 hypothetical protein [Chitinivorax tropicus]